MNRFVRIRSLGIAAAVCLSAAAALAGDTVVEEIIARINNQIITRTELQRSREQVLNEARQQSGAPDEARTAEAEHNLLRDLIDQQLLIQKGEELGLSVDTDLIKRMDQLRKDNNLDSMEALEEAVKKQGLNFEEFKQNLRNGILTQKVIQNEVGSHINASPEEIQQFYEQHKKEMEQPEQVRLSEILIAPEAKPGEQPSADALAAAQQKADQALAELKSGQSFSEVARKYSNGPSAAEGGDLGFFKRGTLNPALEDMTFALKTGDVTGVTPTKQGLVILRVDEHRAAGVPPLKDVEQPISEQLYIQKLEPALRTYLTKLREDAFIDIKTGYVDSGASPNQTQPILTDGANTGAGKLKSRKRKHRFILF
jgi:peptidyl-prolyl cis-trans isomerase SurA